MTLRELRTAQRWQWAKDLPLAEVKQKIVTVDGKKFKIVAFGDTKFVPTGETATSPWILARIPGDRLRVRLLCPV